MKTKKSIFKRLALRELNVAIVTIVLAAGLPVLAAEAVAPNPPVALEAFFQRPAVLEAKLSPSGKQLALTTAKGGDRIGIVVIELSEGYKTTRAANFSDVDVVRFEWVGDKRLVFSVADLEAGSAEDRRYAPGLYAANPDGSDLRQLVRRQGKPFVSNGDTRNQALDWNHMLLSVPQQQEGVLPEEVVVGEMQFGRDELRSVTPMWLNVRTGRSRSLELKNPPAGAIEWWFDSKGQARVASTLNKDQVALHWQGPGDAAWRKLSEASILAQRFTPAAVDDTGNLYVEFADGPAGHAVLSPFDFAKGEPQRPARISAPGFDLLGGLVLDRAGAGALGVRVDTDGEQTIWFDEGMKRMQALADEVLPGRVNRLNCRRCGADDMVVLVRSYSDRDPGRLYLYEAANKRWQPVSKVLDGIEPKRMATVDLHRIKARDGRDLPVWLTQPAGSKAGQPLPTVVLVHGGPWVRSGHWRWEAMQQFLASRGYLVISPEFRGSTGYGDAHYRAGWKQWGQAMQDDVADALLWAQKQGLASEQACIAGASYGGYSALMGLIRHPELYRCGVAWVAVTDPSLLLDSPWWLDDDVGTSSRRYVLPELVGDVKADAAMLSANSPLAQAKRIQAPLLLAFGEEDKRVPLVHGERLRAALKAAGRPPEWVSYRDEGHSWRKVETHVDFARRLEKFLGQHLQKATGP
ncbi:alpha/beta fold hydrolase [Paucibacter sp. DJ2R-2]|uniref:S9 family peptidase n=1 Tax=Paucibacter sp. DJ2R-2 TaxID=2893558 RepID=UPI0021E4D210|nr:alpha/beta fold hydrolase [Paucibacter sp. DJ2R-2]MCV2423021.1 alpha/beta fold hydrolase [Paucibacter sp. DJ4R-1]MCV2440917.1 alpha/beta fold hydrolase [Paucibacter sp. DJ2R-2]